MPSFIFLPVSPGVFLFLSYRQKYPAVFSPCPRGVVKEAFLQCEQVLITL